VTEQKYKVVITSKWYYSLVLVLAVYSMLKNIVTAVITSNAEAALPIVMAWVLLYMIWKKSQHISLALVGWALYFIVKDGIGFFALVLAYGYNGFVDVAIEEVYEKLAFLLMGIVIWIGSYKYVEIHEE
jgi:hypothetical protein